MTLYLFEDAHAAEFLPLTATRPLWDLRVGIFTLLEKLQAERPYGITAVKGLAGGYLAPVFSPEASSEDAVYLNTAYALYRETRDQILSQLTPEGYIEWGGRLLGFRTRQPVQFTTRYASLEQLPAGVSPQGYRDFDIYSTTPNLEHVWDVLGALKTQLVSDWQALAFPKGRINYPIADPHTRVYNPTKVFSEAGVKTYAAILNAEEGPIYLGAGAIVEEGAVLRGPCAVLAGATVTMGAKIRPGTVIGPMCKVGGEVSNSLFWGYSNKGHDGFVGDSLIGQWCNLGAGTNTSNLRNTYAPVKLYSPLRGHTEATGKTFLGLVMGDHAKCGINTMFNTGTVVGVGANVFGAGFPPKYVPDFSWGAEGTARYELPKFLETAARVMTRRSVTLSQTETDLLTHLYHTGPA